MIPCRKTGHGRGRPPFNARDYRGRNVAERSVGKFKEMRRLATRYKKHASSYQAMLTLAMTILYLRALT